MLRLETKEDFERARERLRQRNPKDLIEFLMSLAGDCGPVGAQVRTFIVGDDLTETVKSIRQRIGGISTASESSHRRSFGREVGTTLDLIVESVERLVLPRDPEAAFELLVVLFETDSKAMENCGDHDWEVECAYQRAAATMVAAVKHLPPADVAKRIRALIDADRYGIRRCLASVIPTKRR